VTTPEAPSADPRQRVLMTTGNTVLHPTLSEHTQQQLTADNQGATPSGWVSGKWKRGDDLWQLGLHPHHTIDTSYDNKHVPRQSQGKQRQTRSNDISNQALTLNKIYNKKDNDDLSPQMRHLLSSCLHPTQDTRPTSSHHKKRKRQEELHLDGTRHANLHVAGNQCAAS
jgi:hypothetical protein